MAKVFFFKVRRDFVATVTIAIGSLLTWNYLNGGVPRHYSFANENLPEVSNTMKAMTVTFMKNGEF